jgi:hypothetical protein
VLRLDSSGRYVVEVWRSYDDNWGPVEAYSPVDGSGAPLTEIPFVFVGSTNNDAFVDQAPLYDLAVLNIAHYRNSADYEESCFIVGQPTPYIAGVTEQWIKTAFPKGVQLGSRSAICLPETGSAGLIQAQPNTMTKEAMDHKEKQMLALGAKLVEKSTVQRTLGEAQLDSASETSILTSSANNVSAAYTKSLTTCAMFLGVPDEQCSFKLNTDFPAMALGPADRQQLLLEWQGGAISFSEMRAKLHSAGIAVLDDEAAKDEIEQSGTGPDLSDTTTVQQDQ